MEMAVAGLYRRVLPSPPAIEFASPRGKQLFSEALLGGTMEGFFNLISHFQTQSEPAYCGLATLAVVLNALAIDPGRKWKGPWRWFDETMLDCCEPLEKIRAEGITFGKVACLAHCAGARVEAFRTDWSTVEAFREHVVKCASSQDCHMIVSYHRRPFKQTGTGHFSPIGGYHAESDMALILDVARFKYPPHWVPLTLLWEAMDTIDNATGHHRGFMLISKFQRAPSLLYTLSCRHESWVTTANFLLGELPLLLKSEDLNSVPEVLSLVFTSLPSSSGDFIKWVAEVRRQEEDTRKLSKEEESRLAVKEKVLQQVRETELFKFVTDWLSFESPCCINIPYLSKMDTLPEIAASICCQGMELLTRGMGGTKGFCCIATCVKSLKSSCDSPMTVISGNVASGANEQRIDVLVPVSQLNPSGCCSSVMHPGSSDVLTVLLLALPPHTWSGIKKEQLLAQIHGLVSTKNLPDVLQEEVLHLQRQLHFVKRCKDNMADCDLDQPSPS